ncbi:hypothetical protein ACJX0J_010827, partial [Zea mays]
MVTHQGLSKSCFSCEVYVLLSFHFISFMLVKYSSLLRTLAENVIQEMADRIYLSIWNSSENLEALNFVNEGTLVCRGHLYLIYLNPCCYLHRSIFSQATNEGPIMYFFVQELGAIF